MKKRTIPTIATVIFIILLVAPTVESAETGTGASFDHAIGEINVFGASIGPIVSITPSESIVSVGDDFDVYIEVDPDGYTLQMVQTYLTFNSSLANLTVADGGMFSMFDGGTQNGNTITNITGLDPGVSTTGNLAVLHMHAESAGTFILNLCCTTTGTATGILIPVVNDGVVTVSVCDDPPICGDVAPHPDSDCVVDMDDVALLLNHVGDPQGYPVYKLAGDVNCDGRIDMGDVILLLNRVGDPAEYLLGCCED